jgi:tRNA(fMet)-specific endonuclease VapC
MTLYVLDTDIVTLYRRGHEAVMRHALMHTPEELAITIITVEEQLSGWYALLRRVKTSADLTRVYDRLVETVMFLIHTAGNLASFLLSRIQKGCACMLTEGSSEKK